MTSRRSSKTRQKLSWIRIISFGFFQAFLYIFLDWMSMFAQKFHLQAGGGVYAKLPSNSCFELLPSLPHLVFCLRLTPVGFLTPSYPRGSTCQDHQQTLCCCTTQGHLFLHIFLDLSSELTQLLLETHLSLGFSMTTLYASFLSS